MIHLMRAGHTIVSFHCARITCPEISKKLGLFSKFFQTVQKWFPQCGTNSATAARFYLKMSFFLMSLLIRRLPHWLKKETLLLLKQVVIILITSSNWPILWPLCNYVRMVQKGLKKYLEVFWSFTSIFFLDFALLKSFTAHFTLVK